MAYAPTLTAYLDESPCPRVEVFFESLAPGTATVTVYRLAGRRQFPVRGAVGAPTAGTLARIDFEVPFGIEATYRAEMFDSGGLSLGFTDPASITLNVTDSWMHNPMDPQGAVKVELDGSAAPSISRPVPGEVSRPKGRTVGVILAEPRLGVTGLRVSVATSDLETADKVQALIGDYDVPNVPVICCRWGGDDRRMRVPQPLFLGVLDIPEEDVTVRWGGGDTIQHIVGDETAPPAPGIFIPLLTAADINAYYATAALANAAYLTASDLNRDYTLAGFASS